MHRLTSLILCTAVVLIAGATRLNAQQGVSPAVRAELQTRAGRYPLVSVSLFRGDSAVLVFDDSSNSGKAAMAGTWMFGPPVTKVEEDGCPPEKVLGRQIARVLWRGGGKEAQLKTVIVRVQGTTGLDLYSRTSMYYEPSQLEGPWAGDPEHPNR